MSSFIALVITTFVQIVLLHGAWRIVGVSGDRPDIHFGITLCYGIILMSCLCFILNCV